uniref:Uncharacterized protein n=1 Tax=Escherichia coli TaxID=562 RepID=A0A7U1HRJ5_ECOLX|nr:hypothetical protein [Escherichia coli]
MNAFDDRLSTAGVLFIFFLKRIQDILYKINAIHGH